MRFFLFLWALLLSSARFFSLRRFDSGSRSNINALRLGHIVKVLLKAVVVQDWSCWLPFSGGACSSWYGREVLKLVARWEDRRVGRLKTALL